MQLEWPSYSPRIRLTNDLTSRWEPPGWELALSPDAPIFEEIAKCFSALAVALFPGSPCVRTKNRTASDEKLGRAWEWDYTSCSCWFIYLLTGILIHKWRAETINYQGMCKTVGIVHAVGQLKSLLQVVSHSLCKQYPPSTKYQMHFLKHIMTQVRFFLYKLARKCITAIK